MDGPFFTNRLSYQQPDPVRHHFTHSHPFRGVPVYHIDPAQEAYGPVHPVQRPAERGPGPKVIRIPVHFVGSEQPDNTGSAVKIQKVFRGFLVRKCLKKIKDIKVQVDEIEEKLLNRDVVQVVRRDKRERLRMNEILMSLLFKLDSICGVDFGVRGCRKAVIRKAIALQERIDAIVAADMDGNGGNNDQVTEIRDSGETDTPNPMDLSENSGDLEERVDANVAAELDGNGERNDQVTEIRVSSETDNPNLTDSSENSGNLEGSVECCENLEDDKTMEVNEGNDEEAEIIDVGVDCEVKVSESNVDVKESPGEEDEKGKNGTWIDRDDERKAEKATGGDDNRRSQELLELMMEDNKKMMKLMTQLCERNETQTRMLNALTHRVELLEKAFVCDRLRKKKMMKTKASSQSEEN